MSGGVPAGWVLVPVEPTCDMCVAGWKYADTRDAILGNGEIAALYAAMLAATPTPPPSRDADAERWHSRKIVECDFRLGDCVRCGRRADRLNQRDPCFKPAGLHGHPLHPEMRTAVISIEMQRWVIWAKARQFGLSAEESAELALDAVASARAALQALGERG